MAMDIHQAELLELDEFVKKEKEEVATDDWVLALVSAIQKLAIIQGDVPQRGTEQHGGQGS